MEISGRFKKNPVLTEKDKKVILLYSKPVKDLEKFSEQISYIKHKKSIRADFYY